MIVVKAGNGYKIKLVVSRMSGNSVALKETGIKVPNLEMSPGQVQGKLPGYEGNTAYEKIIQRVKIYSWGKEGKEKTSTVPKIDRTVGLLKRLGFEWPGVTPQHIEKMIAHCREVKFI